jgi:tetratricopeptide (TPR) repeat protein
MLATARIELHDLQGAASDLALATQQARSDTERFALHMNQGRLAYERGKLGPPLMPCPTPTVLLGQLAYVRGMWLEARDHYLRAIQLSVVSPLAHINLVEVYKELGDLKGALAELDKAIALQSSHVPLFVKRAQLHLVRNDKTAARKDLERAVSAKMLKGQEVFLANARLLLGDLHHQNKQYDDALKEFDAALRIIKTWPLAQLHRAETLRASERYAQAGKALDAYLAAGGADNRAVYKMRGLIHTGQRHTRQAIEAYSQALPLQKPRDPETLCFRGWEYLRSQSLPLALADFEEVLKDRPHHADSLCGRGQVRILQNDRIKAIQDADAALKAEMKAAARERREPTRMLLCGVASIYARAALQATPSGRGYAAGLEGPWKEKAIKLVNRALDQLPPKELRFWRNEVLKDPALKAILPNETRP